MARVSARRFALIGTSPERNLAIVPRTRVHVYPPFRPLSTWFRGQQINGRTDTRSQNPRDFRDSLWTSARALSRTLVHSGQRQRLGERETMLLCTSLTNGFTAQSGATTQARDRRRFYRAWGKIRSRRGTVSSILYLRARRLQLNTFPEPR